MYLLVIFCPAVLTILNCFSLKIMSKKSSLITMFLALFITLFFSLVIFYEVILVNSVCLIELNTWFKVGIINIKWSFFFDKLSSFMIFLIIFISLLVHFFALDYLNKDPHLGRFFILLTLFTIFMELLVTSGNLIQFFLGWECVGLMSYLLINFWFSRYSATNSGLMAIIYNRFGDSSVLLGISLMCFILETTDFLSLFLLTKMSCTLQIKIFYNYFSFVDIVTLLLFIGVIGKSAQIFLESWLASAMEGPTPVSSLLHASTMIVSGVFLLQRFQPYILCSNSSMLFITLIGALTAFFAGTVGLVSMDLKRIIAYSTCSQMGYLVFCVGMGNTNISFFHLINHAFFKCLLFISAGCIIHSLFNEQDIRKMGGLFKILPFYYILILIASLSLMGLPFLSGYYSKEKLIEFSFYIFNYSNFFSFWLGSLSACFTSIYSLRFIFITFLYMPQNFKLNYTRIHSDVKSYLNLVLFLLGIGSLYSGFFLEDLIIGLGNDWLIFTSAQRKIYNIDIHLGLLYLNLTAFFYTCLGLVLTGFCFLQQTIYNLYIYFVYKPLKSSLIKISFVDSFFYKIYFFFSKRWFINIFYNRYVASYLFTLGYLNTFSLLDKGFFEVPTLVSTRYLSSIAVFLSSKIFKFMFLSETLLYIFFFFPCFLFFAWFFLGNPLFLNLALPKKRSNKSYIKSLPLSNLYKKRVVCFIKNDKKSV